MKYEVKPAPKGWQVITPEGRVANEVTHKTEAAADKHCLYLNLYFGDKK
jgi:hypothetical protein